MRQVLGMRMGHSASMPCDGLRRRQRACDRWAEQWRLHLHLYLVIPLILRFHGNKYRLAVYSLCSVCDAKRRHPREMATNERPGSFTFVAQIADATSEKSSFRNSYYRQSNPRRRHECT